MRVQLRRLVDTAIQTPGFCEMSCLTGLKCHKVNTVDSYLGIFIDFLNFVLNHMRSTEILCFKRFTEAEVTKEPFPVSCLMNQKQS